MQIKTGAAILVGLFICSALTARSQGFTFATNNGAITISGYTGPGGAVTIPSSIGGLPVVAIGDSAFQQHVSVSSLDLPDSITSIGNWAFAYTSITNLVIPNSVTNLGVITLPGGLSMFADPQSTNFSGRFYRIRSL